MPSSTARPFMRGMTYSTASLGATSSKNIERERAINTLWTEKQEDDDCL